MQPRCSVALVCLSVSVSVRCDHEPCKNGLTDRNAIGGKTAVESCWPRNHASYRGTHRCQLVNTNERSVLSNDAICHYHQCNKWHPQFQRHSSYSWELSSSPNVYQLWQLPPSPQDALFSAGLPTHLATSRAPQIWLTTVHAHKLYLLTYLLVINDISDSNAYSINPGLCLVSTWSLNWIWHCMPANCIAHSMLIGWAPFSIASRVCTIIQLLYCSLINYALKKYQWSLFYISYCIILFHLRQRNLRTAHICAQLLYAEQHKQFWVFPLNLRTITIAHNHVYWREGDSHNAQHRVILP